MAPAGAGTWQPFIWDRTCARPLATHPDDRPGNGLNGSRRSRHPYSVLLPVGFAVPSMLPCPRWALTPPFHPCLRKRRRSALCGTFPGVAPAGRYPAPCFRGARTFLPRGLSALAESGCPANWPAFLSETGRPWPEVSTRYAGDEMARLGSGPRGSAPKSRCRSPARPCIRAAEVPRRCGRSRRSSSPPPRSHPLGWRSVHPPQNRHRDIRGR